MYVTLSLADMIGLMEGTVAAFLAVMLFATQRAGVSWLAAFVSVMALVFLLAVTPAFNFPTPVTDYLRWLGWLQMLAMPFLYRYACAMIRREVRFKALHYVPAAFLAALTVPVGVPLQIGAIAQWALVAQVFLYLPRIMYLVRARRLSLKQNYSNLEGLELRWLERMCLWLLLLVLFDTVLFPLLGIVNIPHATGQFIFTIFSSLYVLWLARSALRQMLLPPLYEPKQEESYQKSGLDPDTASSLAEAVRMAMLERRLYLRADLVLSDLADAAGITTHILSEVLNKTMGQSFYDFVNSHRVEAAKKLLLETEHPILEVAFEAGFNNKVSFNQAFKKNVAMTPSQFRKNKKAA